MCATVQGRGLRDDLFAGTPDTFFIKYLLARAASCNDFGLLVADIGVAFMYARTDEEIYVKVPSCGEEELVRQVHTLLVRSAQQVVVYELQVQEEVEGVRQEVREIERGEQGEKKRSHEHGHVDGVKDSLLEPRCVCA